MKYFVFIITSIFVIGCGSPLFNEDDASPSSSSGPTVSSAKRSSGEDDTKNEDERTEENQASIFDERGCPFEFSESQLCAEIFWLDPEGKDIEGPVRYQDGKSKGPILEVRFWTKKSSEFVDPREEIDGVDFVALKLWMACCVKGTGIPSVSYDSETKIFRFSYLHFYMACPWQIKIQLKSEDLEDDYNVADDPHVIEQVEFQVKDLPVLP